MSYQIKRLPFGSVFSVLFVFHIAFSPNGAQAASGCLKCHESNKLNQKLVEKSRHLVLDIKALQQSVHNEIECIDCHSQLADADAEKPHNAKLGPPTCENCHETPAENYQKSVHGKAFTAGKKGMALCGDCHGAHDIKKVTDPNSRVYKFNLPFTCANCHKNKELAIQHGIKEPDAASQYVESIHGKALLTVGLIVAPSCTDCHGSHEIYRDNDPRSQIHHSNVPKTCGKCHVRVVDEYEKSVHGRILAKHQSQGPVCIDCHTAHQIVQPEKGIFKLENDERCGKCHQDRLKRYRETYHGKAIALGQQNVAACFDCHGHHNILPVDNPKSLLSSKNKLQTCQNCHPKANKNFAGYLTHGDHTDKENYPRLYWSYVFMTGLLLVVFGFFAVHTLLWFTRSIVLFLRDPSAFRKAKHEQKQGDPVYIRFRPIDRFCHFLIIISFILLVITGMPLKFYDTVWARALFNMMGGPTVAAALHRLGALLTGLYFVLHIVSLIESVFRNRSQYRDENGHFRVRKFFHFIFGPDSPMPNWQDFKDFWAHQKWFLGKGQKPQFDRWTYWEKFDYLAVFWGVGLIGLSGLVMWLPETTTKLFPGWVINVALIIHSDEALLAAGFIFTFHFFNVHFRVEKFPMDSVIFSGRITHAEMYDERRRLYDRLKAKEALDKEKWKDEWPRWKRIFNPIGMLAFGIGVALIILIYWAMAQRLLGH